MESKEVLDIEILNFISPHLFYVATDDAKHRAEFLQNVSSRIKKCHLVQHNWPLDDEIVAVHYKTDLVRAIVSEKVSGNEGDYVYLCWLIDHARLIKGERVFKLPKEIQKITPRCRQASLNNICYLREHLELGVTGTIKSVPSLVPNSGVIQYSLELLSNSDKLTFEVAERSNHILIGEVAIHKNGHILYLTRALCDKGLVTINELMFQNLKYSTKQYIKQFSENILETQKPASKTGDEMEEIDIDNVCPLKNGRRRRLLNRSLSPSNISVSSSSDKEDGTLINNSPDKDCQKTELQEGAKKQSKTILLLEKIKARKSTEAAKQVSEADEVNISVSSSCDKEDGTLVNNSPDKACQKAESSPEPQAGAKKQSKTILLLEKIKARKSTEAVKQVLEADEVNISVSSSSDKEDGTLINNSPDKDCQKTESSPEPQEGAKKQSKTILLLEKVKARKSTEAAKQISEAVEPKPISNDDVWKKLAEMRRNKRRSSASEEEGPKQVSEAVEPKPVNISVSSSSDQEDGTLINNSPDKDYQKTESSPKPQEGAKKQSKTILLLEKIKARKSTEADKQVSEAPLEPKPVTNDDIWKKLAEMRRKKERASASEEEFAGCGSDSATEEKSSPESASEKNESFEVQNPSSVSDVSAECSVSPFAAITSQRKSKPKGLFLPAGMNMSNVKKVSSKKVSKGAKIGQDSRNTPKIDEDCPTIKVTDNCSDNLTDDQDEAQNKSEAVEESVSSETSNVDIFTKQDFCRLVAGCTCIKCRVTLEDDDWDGSLKFDAADGENEKKSSAPTDLIIKPPKLLKPQDDEQVSQRNEILSIDYNGMSSMEKKLSCKVLVHGESIPVPIRQVAQVSIHQEIYKNISKINYKESKRIQHYAFPAITRNQHVFMVNDAKSGKTMAYLPILMSFIMEKDERYSQLFKLGGGPIAVVLCSNSKRCEEIHDLMRLILDRQTRKCSLVTYPGYGNISNVDILITMPTVLTTLMSTRATNFKRLCHLVLEDADVILKSHYDLIKKYIHYADDVLEHRNCPKAIQLILCAQHWTSQMEDILTKLNKVPLVCIGNHLEAALYGKMKFTMKFLDTGCKEQNLQRILEDKFKFTKSVVICNPDELEDVQTFLTLKGIEFTSFINATQEDDIQYFETVWNSAPAGKYSVLLCTDDLFNTINITSAHLLIHFSLPHTWSQFIRRFSCFLENIPTPLAPNEKKLEISSYVFVDESCEPRMNKFSNFIKIAGLEKELPDKIKTFFEGVRLQDEYARIARKLELCQNLKLFGKCESSRCKKRHILDKTIDSSDILPKNGSIRFKILNITNAGSCSIKLLEHFDLKGRSLQKFEDLTEQITEILKSKHNYHQPSKVLVNHLYLHKDKDEYFRCKLVEKDEFALVYLIDRGIYSKSNENRLYKMPEELKKIPQQSYEVHFANLVPPYEDDRFSRMAGRKAQFLVDSNCPDSVMTATVVLQLGNNLWVDDVYEYREMHDKSLPAIGFQLTRELVKQGIAVKDSKPLENLYNLCKKADIELLEYKITKPAVKKVSVDQVQPNWAFLDIDAIHEVTFTVALDPLEFYVRQNKFTKQLQQLEEYIQQEIRKPFYPKPKKVEIGKCYLVKDHVTGIYSRGMVLSMEENCAEILCVDYGDVVTDDVSNLKHITNELILKLPFQSIQCSMYGIKPVEGEWCEAARDLLYTMAYEEGTDELRSLFINISSKQDNQIVKRQNSYSVTLKGGFKRKAIINNLLIDCGFAMPNGDVIRDFDLPEVKIESDDDDDSIEEIQRSDDERDDFVNGDETDYSAFDCEILDFDGFVAAFPIRRVDNSKAIEEKKSENNQLPAIKAVAPVDYLTPEVYWSQADANLKIDIKVSDVVSAKMIVKHNRCFQFNTIKDGKTYHLNLILFATVESTVQYTILGSQVRVILKKCKTEEWPRLLHTRDKVRKIYYDIGTLNLMDEEDAVRRPLQLDISDSSADEEEKRPYFVCSDLDSDYDFDIPNDEE